MSDKEKLEKLEEWLKEHKAKRVGDKVYDKCALITEINKGFMGEFFVRLMPIKASSKITDGYYGKILKIDF